MTLKKLVIGVTGMAGSGKSVVVDVAIHNGYDVVAMGDEVREEARRRNMELTPENLGKIMLELRQTEGERAIAKRCIPKIEKTVKRKVLIDGIRSLAEAGEFKKNYANFKLIAVHSSPETRFNRLYNRRRSDDAKDWRTFCERDLRELSVGLGNAIATSEYMIVNEGKFESAKEKAKEILKTVESKWMK
jgi:dephospho-CoA kinase